MWWWWWEHQLPWPFVRTRSRRLRLFGGLTKSSAKSPAVKKHSKIYINGELDQLQMIYFFLSFSLQPFLSAGIMSTFEQCQSAVPCSARIVCEFLVCTSTRLTGSIIEFMTIIFTTSLWSFLFTQSSLAIQNGRVWQTKMKRSCYKFCLLLSSNSRQY